MASGNYAKTFVVNIDGNTDRTFNVTNEYADNKYYENITGLAWQSHSLTVSMTFDGKTVSKSQTHHITGLPYAAAPPSNNSDKTGGHPWTEDQRGWGVVYFQWNDTEFITWNTSGSGATNIIGSPVFNIPSEIPIGISMMAHGFYQKVVISYKYNVKGKVHAGGDSVDFTADGSDLNYDLHSINTLKLTPSNPKIQIENTHKSGDGNRLYIESVSVMYR
jgi:hypothetical protein